MLRFNNRALTDAEKAELFQYILCYGSTTTVIPQNANQKNFNTSYVTVQHNLKLKNQQEHQNFNTSYVTVQLICPCQKYAWNNISIHLMLRFNGISKSSLISIA